jgi:hypothetical protein
VGRCGVVGAEVDVVPDRREQRFGAVQQRGELWPRELVVVRSTVGAVGDQPAILQAGRVAGDVGLRAAKLSDEVDNSSFARL